MATVEVKRHGFIFGDVPVKGVSVCNGTVMSSCSQNDDSGTDLNGGVGVVHYRKTGRQSAKPNRRSSADGAVSESEKQGVACSGIERKSRQRRILS